MVHHLDRWTGYVLAELFIVISYGVGIPGTATDPLAYSLITPAMPFQLEKLGYSGVSALVGWLSFAYVRDSHSSGTTIDGVQSAGLVICSFKLFLLPQSFPTIFHAATIPTAIFSERYNNRRIPMIAGVIIVIGSQIMLMEAPVYAVMCVARVLQGIGSSVVWVVGLALL